HRASRGEPDVRILVRGGARRTTVSREHREPSELETDMSKCFAVMGLVLAMSVGMRAASPVRYRVTFPEPQHRWMQVEATFSDVGASTLELRMSRSSPGRYSIHDFAKNVYDVHAFGSDMREIETTRPDPYGWNVSGHGGSVTIRYKVYGDRIDGTYLGI